MRVLVTAASRHGSTAEIAQRIAESLRAAFAAAPSPPEVVYAPLDKVGPVGRYDAAIIGSALYFGRWLAPARAFVNANTATLRGMQTWIFTSGPVGDTPRPTGVVGDAQKVEDTIGTHGHAVFAGRLRRKDLGLGERLAIAAVRAPEGDYRDWAAIDRWSREVAEALARVGN